MSAPLTGFEASGQARYSTPAEEAAFLRQVDAETHATLTIEGRSVLGNPMWCITIGEGSTILVAANVHPGEPSGRDQALAWFRDLAYATDTATRTYLAAHRVILMPNINIDGSNRPWSRENANGINLNRDYIKLTQPETRAVARVIIRERPVVIVDMHMVGADEGYSWRPFWDAPPGAHPALNTLGQSLHGQVVSELAGEGFTSLEYPTRDLPWGGLSSMAPTWHAVGLLSETAYLSLPDRARVDRIVLDTLLDFHQANRTALDAARLASETTPPTGTIRVPTSSYIGSSTTVPADSTYTIDGTVPTELFELGGIEWDGQTVDLAQPAGLRAAYLLAPASNEYTPNAETWERAADGNPPPEPGPAGTGGLGWVRDGSTLRPVTEAWVRDGSTLRPVTERDPA